MPSWFDKARDLFRKRTKPKRVQPTPGQRGTGSRKPTVSRDEVEDFLRHGTIFFVNSSNVVSAQYFPDPEFKMLIEFYDGSAYLYSNVSEYEALSFAQAPSKGIWVWDHLRIRGTVTGHRKPYVKVK